jgi:uncharacterized protein
MKLLLLVGALLVGVWLWRSGRGNGSKKNVRQRPPPPAAQTEMVRCLHCSVHLPAAEAVPGRLGLYCNQEHRQLAEP